MTSNFFPLSSVLLQLSFSCHSPWSVRLLSTAWSLYHSLNSCNEVPLIKQNRPGWSSICWMNPADSNFLIQESQVAILISTLCCWQDAKIQLLTWSAGGKPLRRKVCGESMVCGITNVCLPFFVQPNFEKLEKIVEEAKKHQLEAKLKARIGLNSLDGTPNSVSVTSKCFHHSTGHEVLTVVWDFTEWVTA